MIGRNDPCWCGSGKKWKKCHFPKKPNVPPNYLKQYGILIKNAKDIDGIRLSGHLAAQILEALCKKAKDGISTEELDKYAQKLHQDAGAIAAPLHYGTPPFPKSICTSVNDVICHGIPGPYTLKDGDIINIDVTTILNGYYGDCSQMIQIGNVSEDKKLVTDVAYDAMMLSIQALKPGLRISEIGNIIESYANEKGCSVVRQFVGHGVGIRFHEPPQIPHFANNLDIPLTEGMTFTIEPMINAGVRKSIIDPTDRWTARTADGKPSAQWEHTLLITADGYEILTLPE